MTAAAPAVTPLRDRMLRYVDYALYGAGTVAVEDPSQNGATAVRDEDAIGEIFAAVAAAPTDREAVTAYLHGWLSLAGITLRGLSAAGDFGRASDRATGGEAVLLRQAADAALAYAGNGGQQ